MSKTLQHIISALDFSAQHNSTFDEWKELCTIAAFILKEKMPEDESYLKECYICNVSAFGLFDKEDDF